MKAMSTQHLPHRAQAGLAVLAAALVLAGCGDRAPETVGSSAEALQAVLEDTDLRAELARRGATRLAQLRPDVVGGQVMAAIAPLLR